MAYRATLQHYRDLIHRSLNGHCMYRVGNASDHLLAHRLVQHGHVHGSKPSITSYVKCVWQHFNETSCACKLRTWGQRVNDQLNVIAVLFGKQCNAIAAQRVRRGGQILSLHCKLYGKRTFKHVVEKYTHTGANYTTVKPLSFLLGAMLFSWEKEKICVADVKIAEEELSSLQACKTDLQSLAKKQMVANLGEGWEQVMDRDHIACWRKPIPNSYLYEYKVYGTFSDLPARAFYNVQIDLDYRRQWDKLVIALDILDRNEETGCEVVQWIMHFPFPMYSREYVYIRKFSINKEKNIMTSLCQATDHPCCPVSDQYVRVTQYRSNMVIKPHSTFDENGFDYILTYYDDPQAAIPSAAIKWMATTGVPDFVDKLHSAAMQQHKWRQNPRDEDSKYEDSEKDSDQVPM